MLLRGSSQQEGLNTDLGVVTGKVDGDGGVPDGDVLIALAEALPRGEWDAVARCREAVADRLGAQSAVDAVAIAAMFNGITRVADGTGIPLDPSTESLTGEMRTDTGIDAFAPPAKWDASAG